MMFVKIRSDESEVNEAATSFFTVFLPLERGEVRIGVMLAERSRITSTRNLPHRGGENGRRAL
jgi:hypothetical protein